MYMYYIHTWAWVPFLLGPSAVAHGSPCLGSALLQIQEAISAAADGLVRALLGDERELKPAELLEDALVCSAMVRERWCKIRVVMIARVVMNFISILMIV
jgi:hypothetical protein